MSIKYIKQTKERLFDTDFNIKLYLKDKYKLRTRYKIFCFAISNKQIKKNIVLS